jgi:heptosyltransferase II
MKKFLVIQTAFIGDAILATVVVEKLHRFFPNDRIDIVVRAGNESLFKMHPFVAKVWVWDKKKNKSRNLRKLIADVRKEHFDYVINLHRFASSGLLTMMSGAKERIGYDKNPFSFAYTVRKRHVITEKQSESYLHEIERHLKLIEHLTDSSSQMPRLYPSPEDEALVQKFMHVPYVTISPSSVWFTKQTPAEVWTTLLLSLPQMRVYLLGGAADRALCESIASEAPNAQVLAGNLSFLQSAALMRGAVMNYTNDSAPMHLCSAVNAPVTAIYCSTIPEFGFGPLSHRSFVVQYHEALDCKPCGLHGRRSCPKGHFRCSHIHNQQLLEVLPA